jgi:hypothetical protein
VAQLLPAMEGQATKLEQSRQETCSRPCRIQMSELRCYCSRPMGQSLDTGSYDLLPKADKRRKAMVDHAKATKQTLSGPEGSSLDPMFWSKTLARLGLESPGYQETVAAIKREKANASKGDV